MIYFIQDEGSLNIKIGYTSGEDAMVRLKELQTGNPSRLVLLGWCPGGKRDEANLHKQFQAAHVQGEWFRPSPDLLRFIISRAGLEFATRAFERAADRLVESEVITIEPDGQQIVEELFDRGVKIWAEKEWPSREFVIKTIGPVTNADRRLLSIKKGVVIDALVSMGHFREWRSEEPVAAGGTLKQVEYSPGMTVRHLRYGTGQVIEVGGQGVLRKVRVLFPVGGERSFLVHNVELEIVPPS